MFKEKSLTPDIKAIVLKAGTEPPFSVCNGEKAKRGSYLCRLCGIALFRFSDKFDSGCGWPSFDTALTTVKQQLDKDGKRTEIVCTRCKAHLGHVFFGENMTAKNQRFCVNANALDWVDNQKVIDSEEVIVAGGCFWGIQHLMGSLDSVIKTEVGYCGGSLEDPSYEQVCAGDSGHLEAVRVLFDSDKQNLHNVIKYFLESHNPFQSEGQGLDIGAQYRSAIFYFNQSQKEIAERWLSELEALHHKKTATLVLPVSTFWHAEAYHQDYLQKHPQTNCHQRVKRF